jgi:serine/threonine protein kinase
MPSERIQRQIDALLDEAEQAVRQSDWALVRSRAEQVLAFDPENADALAFGLAAERASSTPPAAPSETVPPSQPSIPAPTATPASFVNGRYEVKRFLGEGGKKKVYLAHDTLLDRDVAFALIKTEGLDDIGRDRIKREAQAMGRLGSHPHIVSVFDLGEEADGQPYIVTELMGGGDVEGLIEKAPEHRPSLERTLGIGSEVCQGLEFAHSKGIVHRDLKPGNVWLTAAG